MVKTKNSEEEMDRGSRLSAKRKAEAVLRLLRGEELDTARATCG